ncbi:MAG: YdcF family protein [Ignavibacteria bacterium]|nr:YdcF family protein [Ignavibacteria bacterium]
MGRSRSYLSVILIIEALSFGCLYYLRYKNQNLYLNGFENKSGNVISIVFFSTLILLTLIGFFIPEHLSKTSLIFLTFISAAGFLSLVLSDFYFLKESKIILVSTFLVIYIFLLSSFLGIVFSGSKKFRFFKSVFVFLGILTACIGIVFIKVLNFTDDQNKYESSVNKADAGVILGAAVWGGNRPSPVLKERINKGYDIYQKNIVPKLVITGGGSPNELTEGEVSKNVLIKYGVTPENLILENSSSSTVEQIKFVRDSLYNLRNWEKIILVSDNFHLYRSSEICKFNDISADCIASDKELSAEGTYSFCLKESLALIIFWMTGI